MLKRTVRGFVWIAAASLVASCGVIGDLPEEHPTGTSSVEPTEQAGSAARPPTSDASTPQEPARSTSQKALEPIDVSDFRFTGPFLYESLQDEGFDVEGRTTFRVPGGDPINLDMESFLPGEEIVTQSWAYGWEDDPFIVGLAEIRTAASGLTPESTMHSLIRIEVDEPTTIAARVDLELEEPAWLYTAAPGAMVVIGHDFNSNDVLGVELRDAGGVRWRINDGRRLTVSSTTWRGDVPPEVAVGLFSHLDGVCKDDNFQEGIDLTNGEPVWRENYGSDYKCHGSTHNDHHDSRYFDIWYSEDERLMSKSIATGNKVDLTRYAGLGEIDLTGSIAWLGVSLTWSEDDPAVFGFVDLETGAELFTMDREDVLALELEVLSIYDGLANATSSDENIVIDTRTGDVLGTWVERPVEAVGEWVLLSDDTLHPPGWAFDE